MTPVDLLVDAFGRVHDVVHQAVDGLSADHLTYRPDAEANSIGWLVWHLTRVQDDHIADAAQSDQVWTTGDWVERFGLPFDPTATGYGHSAQDVAALRIDSAELLTAYHDAVYQRSLDYLRGLTAADLDRVVDERWDPPVTLAVRLVSVVSDDLQHGGQAAYVRGLAERR